MCGRSEREASNDQQEFGMCFPGRAAGGLVGSAGSVLWRRRRQICRPSESLVGLGDVALSCAEEKMDVASFQE